MASRPDLYQNWVLGPGVTKYGESGYQLAIESTGSYQVVSMCQSLDGRLPNTTFNVLQINNNLSDQYIDLWANCSNSGGDGFQVHYSGPNAGSPAFVSGVIEFSNGNYTSNSTSFTDDPYVFGYNSKALTAGGNPFMELPPSFQSGPVSCALNFMALSEFETALNANATVNITQPTGPFLPKSPTGSNSGEALFWIFVLMPLWIAPLAGLVTYCLVRCDEKANVPETQPNTPEIRSRASSVSPIVPDRGSGNGIYLELPIVDGNEPA